MTTVDEYIQLWDLLQANFQRMQDRSVYTSADVKEQEQLIKEMRELVGGQIIGVG